MSKPEIIERTPINVVAVKQALKAIKKRDEELNFRAQRTEEYVNQVAKLKIKEAEDLVKQLEALDIPRLKPEYIQKIVDILPQNEKHLKIVLQGYTLSVSGDNQKKIMAVVKPFLPK